METEYASKGVAGSGLGLGIAGTALGLLNAHGGLGGLFGGRSSIAGAANDAAVLEMAKKDAEIAQLKADAATDAKLVEVYKVLRAQDKEQDAKISDLNTRVTSLETSAPLREQIVIGKINEVAALAQNGIATNSAAIACLKQTVSGITATYVPASQVTPLPMMRYNFWQAPTEPAATTAVKEAA